MTTKTDIVNRALQSIGTRTTVTDAELAGNTTNEAIQANLIYDNIRKRLLRMAPWACGLTTANLVYVSSVPGTPENTSAPTTMWQRGQPTPPWAYEYQYPVDCLRVCWIIPTTQTGYAGGVPITTAVTGGAPSFWQGPPVKFAVMNDSFYPVVAAAIASAGVGYVAGDVITLVAGLNTNPPIGAPAQLLVNTVNGSGGITSASVITQVLDSPTPLGGSYFEKQTNPVAQGSTDGNGTGAAFNLTFGNLAPQRVVLCNQEFASSVYISNVTDPNIFDDMFQDAFAKILGGSLSMALTGDKKLANAAISLANEAIHLARTADGNEGLTINDITPDWIRIRGTDFPSAYSGPYLGYDWGGMWPYFG